MDCPNCYTKGLSSKLMRCPRCDWLLLEPAPASASAALPTPPVQNPWSDSLDPALPVLLPTASPEDQLKRASNLADQAYNANAPELVQAPISLQSRELQSMQNAAATTLAPSERAFLLGKALGALVPFIFVGFVLVSKIDSLRTMFREFVFQDSSIYLVGGVIVLLLIVRVLRGLRFLVDGLSGQVTQEVDVVKRVSLTGSSLEFERAGRLTLSNPKAAKQIRAGERYRIRYSRLSRIMWSLDVI